MKVNDFMEENSCGLEFYSWRLWSGDALGLQGIEGKLEHSSSKVKKVQVIHLAWDLQGGAKQFQMWVWNRAEGETFQQMGERWEERLEGT